MRPRLPDNVVSIAERHPRIGCDLILRFFGRHSHSLGAFLSYHSVGPDGRCTGCIDKLKPVHPELVSWFWNKVLPPFPNAHVSWGFRNEQLQNGCFASGATKLKWPDSAHNKTPAMAIDLFQIMPGNSTSSGVATWTPSFFSSLAETNKKLGLPIVWGGEWKDLGDKDHFQLTETPEDTAS